jgi:hypothetical protein
MNVGSRSLDLFSSACQLFCLSGLFDISPQSSCHIERRGHSRFVGSLIHSRHVFSGVGGAHGPAGFDSPRLFSSFISANSNWRETSIRSYDSLEPAQQELVRNGTVNTSHHGAID